jgi:hypothetical protein
MHKARAFFLVCAGVLGLAHLLPRPATAAWPSDPLVNLPLCTATDNQYGALPQIVSDGAGGAIVTWWDYRGGAYDIYAQRVSAEGTAQWTADGVAICTATGDQYDPTIAPDGMGGAIVTWQDYRSGNSDIYAQKISAAGAVQWATNGVAVCIGPPFSVQAYPEIVSDGAGGAIVTWEDLRGASAYDVYAQRISAAGAVQWTANGVPLGAVYGDQVRPKIVSDGVGGAIVTWQDARSSIYVIYAQRISADGAVQWPANGVALCTPGYSATYPAITSDGAGGAIVAWEDLYRYSGTTWTICAQRISATGTVQWTANGLPLCTASGSQVYPAVIPDAAGGAFVTWHDYRSGITSDIYAQRISAGGTVQWTVDGVPLCTADSSQTDPTIVSDGVGGAIVTWKDGRNGSADIYAQRISPTGTVQWTSDGVALCVAPGTQEYPTIVSDQVGGAIVTWEDFRSGTGYDVYAQNINSNGTLGGGPTPVLLSFVTADVGADFITLTWLVGGSRGAVATVYRSYVGREWTRIGEVTADGSGYLRYTDHVDATATRVGYRLGIVEAGVEGFHGETWVDTPTFEFALDPVRPNPTRGGALMVNFTLPSGVAASLELLDVAGRRIVRREVGSFGAGHHTLDLRESRRLAPGLYLVCLRQGVNTRLTRVAVLK